MREPLSDITVASGRDTLLRCVISGEPKPDVTWRKNGLVIGQMLDFKQIYKNDEAVLEISKICSKDAGCYECTASNEKGEISTSCQLIVQGKTVHDNAKTVQDYAKTVQNNARTDQHNAKTVQDGPTTVQVNAKTHQIMLNLSKVMLKLSKVILKLSKIMLKLSKEMVKWSK